MREPPVTSPDRRQTPRTKLVEIAYIGMGPENGGLVLDVSDGGLSFHAVSPVQPSEKINFLLSVRGLNRIEGAGEVVWTNEMKTVCGLRFTSLSGDAREHLNNWTNQSRMSVAATQMDVSPGPAASPQREESSDADADPSDAKPDPIFAIPPALESYLSEPMGKSMWGGQLFLWIIFALTGLALLSSAYLYGVHIGRSEVSSEIQPSATPTPQAEPPTLAPAPVAPPAVPNELPAVPSETTPAPNSAPVSNPKSEFKSTKAQQPPAAEEQVAAFSEQHPLPASDSGKSELAAAMTILGGPKGKRDTSKAARLLWTAVGNGNSTAEVALADLYLHGNGVVKSCEQGRVLLQAAAISGNVLGQSKLDELDTNGCP
jgi:hypothetical protein